ncbi:response regulator [bacterium]|nr:response regulator [bacterium]
MNKFGVVDRKDRQRNSQILLVEDENIVAMDIKKMIEELGFQVCGIASSGEVAVRMVEEKSTDLVLMDIGLKGKMDGIETFIFIQRRFSIPGIYLTSYNDGRTLNRAMETKPQGILIKPCGKFEMKQSIENALGKGK